MKIEQARESDFSEIENIFRNGFLKDSDMYLIHSADHLYVAKDGIQIIGAGGLFTNSLHAKVPKVAIAVEQQHRRKGLGKKIHQKILESHPFYSLGFDGCCFDVDVQAIAFMKALKYRPYLDCLIASIDINADFPNFEDLNKIKLLTFNQVVASGIELNTVLRFLVDRYIESHSWSPVTIQKESADWEEIVLSDINQDMSMVALIDNEVVGASTASLEQDILDIQWIFAKKDSFQLESVILVSLLKEQFRFARNNKISIATLEVDSTEECLFKNVKNLKLVETETWKRFRYSSAVK